jgi:hypothetical protein
MSGVKRKKKAANGARIEAYREYQKRYKRWLRLGKPGGVFRLWKE